MGQSSKLRVQQCLDFFHSLPYYWLQLVLNGVEIGTQRNLGMEDMEEVSNLITEVTNLLMEDTNLILTMEVTTNLPLLVSSLAWLEQVLTQFLELESHSSLELLESLEQMEFLLLLEHLELEPCLSE